MTRFFADPLPVSFLFITSCAAPLDSLSPSTNSSEPPLSAQVGTSLVPNDTSFFLREQQIRAIIQRLPTPGGKSSIASDIQALPDAYSLASHTGYLIRLTETDPRFSPSFCRAHSAEFSTLKAAFSRLGYVSAMSPSDETVEYLIPSALTLAGIDVDYFLDGKLAEGLLQQTLKWAEFEQSVKVWIGANVASRDSTRQLQASRDDLQLSVATLRAGIKEAQDAIDRLDSEIRSAKSRLDGDPNDKSVLMTPSFDANYSPLNRLKKLNLSGSPDVFAPVLEHLLESIVGKSYNTNSVSSPYLQPDVVRSLDELVARETEALAAIGISSLALESAARTPLRQLELIGKRPITGGMFSSGHVFGVCIDLKLSGFDFDKNDRALTQLFAKYHLVRPLSAAAERNHFCIDRYLTDSRYANAIRTRMLDAYLDALTGARRLQQHYAHALACEAADYTQRQANFTAELQQLAKDKEAAQSQLGTLKADETNRVAELARLRDAIAAKDSARDKNRKQARDHHREGSANRPDKDGYWERYSSWEFHSEDCHGAGSTYENSSGERRNDGYMECRSNPGGSAGIAEAGAGPLP